MQETADRPEITTIVPIFMSLSYGIWIVIIRHAGTTRMRRDVSRPLVAWAPVRDLLLRANHLFVAAVVRLGCAATWLAGRIRPQGARSAGYFRTPPRPRMATRS
jgi:hypothetical protein